MKPLSKGWFVYILRCRDGTLYTGTTVDVPMRLVAHGNGVGAKYTRSAVLQVDLLELGPKLVRRAKSLLDHHALERLDGQCHLAHGSLELVRVDRALRTRANRMTAGKPRPALGGRWREAN